MIEQQRPPGVPVAGVRPASPPPPGWVPTGPGPMRPAPAPAGLVQLLGPRRELVAWLLTTAAAVLVVGRVVALFAYPVLEGLRLNAIGVGPGLAGVDLLLVAVAAALLAVAGESTPKSRLIVLIDLLVLAVAGIVALIGLGLTVAAYEVTGIAGLVTGAALVQVGNLLALVVAILVVRRALTRTPRPSARSARAPSGRPAPPAGPQRPVYGPPPGAHGRPGQAPPYDPRSPYGYTPALRSAAARRVGGRTASGPSGRAAPVAAGQ